MVGRTTQSLCCPYKDGVSETWVRRQRDLIKRQSRNEPSTEGVNHDPRVEIHSVEVPPEEVRGKNMRVSETRSTTRSTTPLSSLISRGGETPNGVEQDRVG